MAQERKYGQLDIPGIPADEPVFILRAQDLTAMEMLRVYGLMCEQAGSPAEHVEFVNGTRDIFGAWREAHEPDVHVPDTDVAAVTARQQGAVPAEPAPVVTEAPVAAEGS